MSRAEEWGSRHAHLRSALLYMRRNPSLPVGIIMLFGLIGFTLIGSLFTDVGDTRVMSAMHSRPPSENLPFGTDRQGRDLFAVMVHGTWLTVRVGLIAGAVGIFIGASLGFIAGYFGGWVDNIINWSVDVLLTVPAMLFLVVIATNISTPTEPISSTTMAVIIAALAWRRPTRQIRSQVLVMRSAGYVQSARLSGMSSLEVIFAEMVPNLLPYLVASFVTAVSAAVLASVGLEAMGLGPQNEPTLGQTIYWMIQSSAFMLGMWWWILPPIGALVILFVSLYLINTGIDELSNPRLRRKI
ncbi:MAG: ABC transporter permease [Pseudomonadota bacterium]